MKHDSITYLVDAIRRIEGGEVVSPHGSWGMGVFGQAVNDFEKEVRAYVGQLLDRCGLNYDGDLRGALKGAPPFQKLTLGQLVALLEEASKRNALCVSKQVPGGWKLSGFLNILKNVNEAWVQIKHGDEVEVPLLLTRMKSMLKLLQLLPRR